MDYALAKDLKDAGFTQAGKSNDWAVVPQEIGDPTRSFELAYLPTLEELIGACGEKFSNLHAPHGNGLPNDIQWKATGFWEGDLRYSVYGTTATEAVARLWLALNKK